MHQGDLERDPKPEIPKSSCKTCSSKQKHYVPKPVDVPEELRGLSEDALQALRPLDVNVGPERRSKTDYGKDNGYR